MSDKHPIIAVTGSSGAGTSTVKTAFEHIFFREQVSACFIGGDSYHRYNREEMRQEVKSALAEGRNLSHFGPEGNHFEQLEQLFRTYGEDGTGNRRFYIHDDAEAKAFKCESGTFTPWEPIPANTDLLFYEGLHGGVADGNINAARHPDLLIGVVPIVNLEWIQKIHRDTAERGYDAKDVTDNILRRMHDYVHYIAPQFSLTDINFQRVPTVDTSNPFIARDIPTADESFCVIRVRDPVKFGIDFPYLLTMMHNSFMSRRNSIVIPAGKMGLAIEIIFSPILENMMQKRRRLLRAR